MKLDKRAIVRKRTQQLVYVELGRDNGGVMLNLTEHGCGFQAISPVKVGETRFAFQISGGRRIAGDAEAVWVDELGIMGGLRFLNLDAQPQQEIRRWLVETNAADEPGDGIESNSIPPVSSEPPPLLRPRREEISSPPPPRDYRPTSWPPANPHVAEEPPVHPGWGNVLTGASAVIDDRPRFPAWTEEPAFESGHRKSVALWRGIAAIAIAAALGALLVAYQHEVGRSLIWLGETLSDKTRASTTFTPPEKATPAATVPSTAAATDSVHETQIPAAQKSSSSAPLSSEDPLTPETAIGSGVPSNSSSSAQNPSAASPADGASESVLERQSSQRKPEPLNTSDSVESLWGAVQGGSVSAEISLAERFVRGDGVLKNCDQAKVLLRAASRRGSREATLRLYQLESEGCR